MLTIDQKIQVLNHLMPDCSRIVNGDQLIWLDTRPIPTDAEMEAQWYQINLSNVKAKKLIELKRYEGIINAGGFQWDFNGTMTDMLAAASISDHLLLGSFASRAWLLQQRDPTGTIAIRAVSGITYQIGATEAVDLAVAVNDHFLSKSLIVWDLEDQIKACTTPEAVDAIVIPTA